MKSAPTLARRVLIGIAATQILVLVIGPCMALALAFWSQGNLDEWAADRVDALVVNSIIRDESGDVRIEPSAELKREMLRTPDLLFAAFDPHSNAPLAGSSARLAEALQDMLRLRTSHVHYYLPHDIADKVQGTFGLQWTRHGPYYVGIYNQKFYWSIILDVARGQLEFFLPYLLFVLLFTTGVSWYTMRQCLRPLRALSEQASQVDLDRLSRQFSEKEVPGEIVPFVHAVNDALARVDGSAQRMRRYFANAAHELRTPLAIMRARLENAPESTLVVNLMSDTSKLQTIVEQALSAARLEERKEAFDAEVDLQETVQQVVRSFFPLGVKCGRSIEFEESENAGFVKGSAAAIAGVVGNLIDNALKMEPEGGAVIVRMDGRTGVQVEDHGKGVAPQDRERIFEPFWRESESTSGAGLGLAIARDLMEKLGGQIWVEDTPGGGATFKLCFLRAPSGDRGIKSEDRLGAASLPGLPQRVKIVMPLQ
jgi:signal transduction histidine kinase